jgi:hypothetical protein
LVRHILTVWVLYEVGELKGLEQIPQLVQSHPPLLS